MTNIADAFPSKYLSAADLAGQDHQVVIARVERDKIGDETKYILHFQNTQKGLVLNKTNAKAIASQHGGELEQWVGKMITIGTAWVDYRGDTVEAIRVRPVAAPVAAAIPADSPMGGAGPGLDGTPPVAPAIGAVTTVTPAAPPATPPVVAPAAPPTDDPTA